MGDRGSDAGPVVGVDAGDDLVYGFCKVVSGVAMPRNKLSHKQEEAIAALLRYPTLEEAAKAVGVAPSTIWRWLQDGSFRQAYEAARKQVLSRAIESLQAASEGAVATLVELKDKATKESVRLNAAKALLDLAFNTAALLEIEERLERLEELVERGRANEGLKATH